MFVPSSSWNAPIDIDVLVLTARALGDIEIDAGKSFQVAQLR